MKGAEPLTRSSLSVPRGPIITGLIASQREGPRRGTVPGSVLLSYHQQECRRHQWWRSGSFDRTRASQCARGSRSHAVRSARSLSKVRIPEGHMGQVPMAVVGPHHRDDGLSHPPSGQFLGREDHQRLAARRVSVAAPASALPAVLGRLAARSRLQHREGVRHLIVASGEIRQRTATLPWPGL